MTRAPLTLNADGSANGPTLENLRDALALTVTDIDHLTRLEACGTVTAHDAGLLARHVQAQLDHVRDLLLLRDAADVLNLAAEHRRAFEADQAALAESEQPDAPLSLHLH